MIALFSVGVLTGSLGGGLISKRWIILFVLFFGRLTMAFQFQSVAALSPLIIDNYAVSLVDIGLLIGLFLAPGVIIAIPGGTIAARFGDRKIVIIAMGLMLIGAGIFSAASSWEWFIVGRLISGVGGVIVNVVMSKMLVDWFAGSEIATAMAIFINSWPVGIALAMLTLPSIAAIGGLDLAWAFVLSSIILGLLLFILIYRSPENLPPPAQGLKLAQFPVLALLLSALIWALYNTAFVMITSFAAAMLASRGWDFVSASTFVSISLVVFSLALPLGGFLADRTGYRYTIIAISFLSYAILMPMTLVAPNSVIVAIFIIVGVLFGFGAGPIMSLPSEVLPPAARALGMGVFFSVYYALMMIAPAIAGEMSDRAGNAGIAIIFGAVMSVIGLISLIAFRRLTSRVSAVE